MTRIRLRRDVAANWTSSNPVLSSGEVGVELSATLGRSPRLKVGDGTTAWSSLDYIDRYSRPAASDDVLTTEVVGDSQKRYVLNADGSMEWGDGAGAADTTLSRASVGRLQVNDTGVGNNGFVVGTNTFFGRAANAEPGMTFVGDTSLTRSGAGLIAMNAGTAALVKGGAAGPSGQAGLLFGSGLDTNLYRSAPDTLKTDDQLYVGSTFYASQGYSYQVGLGGFGPGTTAGVSFGSSGDAVLYRGGAANLRTDSSLYAASDISARYGASSQTGIGLVGPSSEPGIVFGSAGDTSLYRAATDTLHTDDAFRALHVTTKSGSLYGGSVEYAGQNSVHLASGPPGSTGLDGSIYVGPAGSQSTVGRITLKAVSGVGQLGFYGATAVARPTVNAAAGAPSATYVQAEATAVRDLVNGIRTALVNLGLVA